MFCDKKVNVLLGAGASARIAPSTYDITQSLLGWTRYMPSQPMLDFTTALSQTHYQGGNQKKYFQALFELVSPFIDSPTDFLHFERLIFLSSQLDSFTTGRVRDLYSTGVKSLVRPLFSVRKKARGFDNKLIHNGVTEEACSYILDYVTISYSSRPDLHLLPMNKFFKELDGESVSLNIFSLNYDAIPSHCGLDFETGFNRRQSGQNFFSLASLYESEKKHSFIQLHGSSLFGYPGNNGYGKYLVVRCDDEQSALSNRQSTLSSGTWNQDGSQNPHRLMITGMRKADFLLDEPFAAYFHKFRADLFKTPRMLLVGYGGGDRHVNESIQSAMDFWKEKGQRLKIVWIGYAPDNCFEDGVATWDQGSKVLGTCGNTIGQTFGADVANYLGHPRTLWRIKRNEVQRVALENIDLIFSFKGTDLTFSENQEAIASFLSI
ncbi:hypothetical protein ACES2J_06150 [Bdellovibrio bacteriovorus]|uniref:hypothetical protein n=1 Tax=Bdellovibrio bacteriovorus TaxID=959 RepID=UPI0035A65446